VPAGARSRNRSLPPENVSFCHPQASGARRLRAAKVTSLLAPAQIGTKFLAQENFKADS
jgi:hypothetical protein